MLSANDKAQISKRATPRWYFSRLPKFLKKIIYFLVHQYRIFIWDKKGNPVPPPHAIKQQTILSFNKNKQHKYFVETGTYLGDMLEALQYDFEQLYSCELVPFIHDLAVKRFQNRENIHIILGDSTFALPEIMKNIKAPALFWLDGHYSGGDTGWSDVNGGCPIYDEMKTIFDSPYKHSIIIDDARCFNGDEVGYPVLEDFIKTVKELYPIEFIEVKDDLIRIIKK
jgi:hypothetical protein